MRYQVISGANLSEFEKQVESAIRFGWEPVGGVAIHREMGELMVYAQALKMPRLPNSFGDPA